MTRWMLPFALAFSVLFAATLAEAAKPKIAFLPSPDRVCGSLVDVVEAKLSAEADFDVVDRMQIQKILKDQKLSLEGRISADQMVAVGQVVPGDIFFQVSLSKAFDSSGTIAVLGFDLRTGARLVDTTLGKAKFDVQAVEFEKVVRAALDKYKASEQGKGITVTLLPARGVGLRDELADVPETIGPLLERALLEAKDLSLLERKRLALINKESKLTADRRASLLSSSVLLGLDVTPGESRDSVKLRCTATGSNGSKIGSVEVSGSVRELYSLVMKLARDIASELGSAALPESSGNILQEVDRWMALGEWHRGRGQKAEMMSAYTVALALSEGAMSMDAENKQALVRFLRINSKLARETLSPINRHRPSVEHKVKESDTPGLVARIDRMAQLTIANYSSIGRQDRDAVFSLIRELAKRQEEMRLPERQRVDSMRKGILKTRITKELSNAKEPKIDVRLFLGMFPSTEALIHALRTYSKELEFYAYPVRYLPQTAGLSDAILREMEIMFRYWVAMDDIDDETRVASYLVLARIYHQNSGLFDGADANVKRCITNVTALAAKNPALANTMGSEFMRGGLPVDQCVAAGRRIVALSNADEKSAYTLLLFLDRHDATGAQYPGYYLYRLLSTAEGSARDQADAHLLERYGPRHYQGEPSYTSSVKKQELFSLHPPEERSKRPPSWITAAAVEGNEARLVLANHRGSLLTYSLASVDLSTRTVKKFDRGATALLGRGLPKPQFARHLGFKGKYAYCSTEHGILFLPLSGGAGSILRPKADLPVDTVTAVCWAGDWVYAAGSGCFFRCRPDGSEVQILASSDRQERRSPLDNTPSRFGVSEIVHDGASGKILFEVYYRRPPGELYSCDPSSGTVTKEKLRLSDEHLERYLKQIRAPEEEGNPNNTADKRKQIADVMQAALTPASMTVLGEDMYGVPEPPRPKRRSKRTIRHPDGTWWKCILDDKGKPLHARLDPLDVYTPTYLEAYKNSLVAVSPNGLWLLSPEKGVKSDSGQRGASASVSLRAPEGSPSAEVTLRSRFGGVLRIDDIPYYIWPDKPLHWSRMKTGMHDVAVSWEGKSWSKTLDLKDGDKIDIEAFPDITPKTRKFRLSNGVELDMAWVSPGDFTRTLHYPPDSQPPFRIRITQGFWMSRRPITLEQYKAVIENCGKDPKRPASTDRMTHVDVEVFLKQVSSVLGPQLGDNVVRLPTEAEWEYACNVGLTNALYLGSDEDYTWSAFRRAGRGTGKEGLGAVMNSFGLYDMNAMLVACRDWGKKIWIPSAYYRLPYHLPDQLVDPLGLSKPTGGRPGDIGWVAKGGSAAWADRKVWNECRMGNGGSNHYAARIRLVFGKPLRSEQSTGSSEPEARTSSKPDAGNRKKPSDGAGWIKL